MKQLNQRVGELVMFCLGVFSGISFVCLFSAVATDNSLGEVKQMISDCNQTDKPELAVDIVDDLVDRRITRAEKDWREEWDNFKNRLSSDVYAEAVKYDTVLEKCEEIIKNTH